uniref:Uncharacterized protein n=1 Tax=Tetranychus urticae TaxID=32264 RepID=T1K400_TETUR
MGHFVVLQVLHKLLSHNRFQIKLLCLSR